MGTKGEESRSVKEGNEIWSRIFRLVGGITRFGKLTKQNGEWKKIYQFSGVTRRKRKTIP